MDNSHLKKYIVRYHRENPNGSWAEFNVQDFETLDEAQKFLKRKESIAYPTEKYWIIEN